MIKLDIINEVVNKTGITKTKAELAVETVFESMKRSPLEIIKRRSMFITTYLGSGRSRRWRLILNAVRKASSS